MGSTLAPPTQAFATIQKALHVPNTDVIMVTIRRMAPHGKFVFPNQKSGSKSISMWLMLIMTVSPGEFWEHAYVETTVRPIEIFSAHTWYHRKTRGWRANGYRVIFYWRNLQGVDV